MCGCYLQASLWVESGPCPPACLNGSTRPEPPATVSGVPCGSSVSGHRISCTCQPEQAVATSMLQEWFRNTKLVGAGRQLDGNAAGRAVVLTTSLSGRSAVGWVQAPHIAADRLCFRRCTCEVYQAPVSAHNTHQITAAFGKLLLDVIGLHTYSIAALQACGMWILTSGRLSWCRWCTSPPVAMPKRPGARPPAGGLAPVAESLLLLPT
jgi:hypothetical protein